MILYFSATGNSKYVAERLAAHLGEETFSIENCTSELQLSSDESLGIVSPTYCALLPTIMRDFLENSTIKADGDNCTYFVATCGASPGCTGGQVSAMLKKKGLSLEARYSIKMPDTWTPNFDVSDKVKIEAKKQEVEKTLPVLFSHIDLRKKGNFMKLSSPKFLSGIAGALYDKIRRTDKFHVEEGCIGCGLCAKACPDGAIEMEKGRPVWKKERCVICLRCLHHCPTFSIQYGEKTKSHGQYVNPHTKV